MSIYNQIAVQTDSELFIASHTLASVIGAPLKLYTDEMILYDFELNDIIVTENSVWKQIDYILRYYGESVTVPTTVAYLGIFSFLISTINKAECEKICMALASVPESHEYYSDLVASSIVFYLHPELDSLLNYERDQSLVSKITDWLTQSVKFLTFDPFDLIRDTSSKITYLPQHQRNNLEYNFYPIIKVEEGKVLGEGGTCRVYASGKYAVKVISNEWGYKSSLNEIITLITLKHRNIISLRSFTLTPESASIIMDRAESSLDSILYPTKEAFFKSQEDWEEVYIYGKIRKIRFINFISDLLHGLSYVHSQGICELDIKPQNLLVDDNRLLITDLGTARHFTHTLREGKINISTPYYRDIRLNELYLKYHNAWPSVFVEWSYEVDVWAAGLTIVEILTGIMMLFTPSADQIEMVKEIVDKTYQVLTNKFSCITNPNLRKMVTQMLDGDKDLRITVDQALTLLSQ
jgi:hypothetical protein